MLACSTLAVSSQVALDSDPRSAGLLQYLNHTITWYRQIDLQRQMAADPDEGMLVNENQQIGSQVVSLAFDFARVRAESIEKDASEQAGGRGQAGASRYQNLRRMVTGLDQQIRSDQAEIDSLQEKLSNQTGPQRESLVPAGLDHLALPRGEFLVQLDQRLFRLFDPQLNLFCCCHTLSFPKYSIKMDLNGMNITEANKSQEDICLP